MKRNMTIDEQKREKARKSKLISDPNSVINLQIQDIEEKLQYLRCPPKDSLYYNKDNTEYIKVYESKLMELRLKYQ